jgi:hypothetical protein
LAYNHLQERILNPESQEISMKIACRIAVAALVLAFSAPLVKAQMMFHTPDMRGIWNPVVGTGGSYETTQEGSDDKRHMDIFVVGKETVDGKDGYWLEFAMPSPRGSGDFIMKSLLVVDGSDAALYRTVMQIPGMPAPMEMSKEMLANQDKKPMDLRGSAKKVGTETITTPAGTFETDHWQSTDGSDAWISPKVPPYGLIKSVTKDGHTIMLTSVITDAKDRITGTPVPFDPTHIMPPGKKPQ